MVNEGLLQAVSLGLAASFRNAGSMLLLQGISPFLFFYDTHNPFDYMHLHGVSLILALRGSRYRAMLEAFTALFAVMSAGVFIAHAIDGYRSRV